MKHGFIVLESDQHAGDTHGLSPEVLTVKDDQGKDVEIHPSLTATQKRILALRRANIATLPTLVGRKPWYYLNLGDQVQGNKYIDPGMQIGRYKQALIALHNFREIASIKPAPKCIRIADGTLSHDEDIGRLLHNQYAGEFSKLDIRTAFYGLSSFQGFTVDHKHRGPAGGSRNWTKDNSAYLYLKSEVKDELAAGRKPPNLYVRGHIHVEIFVTYNYLWRGNWHTSHLITVPPMCGAGSYAKNVVANLKEITNGWLIPEIVNDVIVYVHRFVDSEMLRYTEVIE